MKLYVQICIKKDQIEETNLIAIIIIIIIIIIKQKN